MVKPHEPAPNNSLQPPLGILYLISALRAEFGPRIDVGYRDLSLEDQGPEECAAAIAGHYDLVGISALNFEADATNRLALELKRIAPQTIIAVGGPYARSEPQKIMACGAVDLIFRGESERTFPKAVSRIFDGDGDLGGIPGVTWRKAAREDYVVNEGEDSIEDVDSIAFPAWDLVPFDRYARRANMNSSLRARRYAPLFTSRGCPYRCHYCHDMFGKGFRWRSPENILAEIELLVERYGVGEFEIVDDIFNLHKPRMREIARRVIARHGKRNLFFCFPNGIRADIIDLNDLPLLRDMGVYDMSIAIETVSARLQALIDKNLNVEKARAVINGAHAAGISTKGFFMVGFPTESLAEIENTIRFALESKLTMAHFFFVVPQKGTPLFELAQKESPDALKTVAMRDYYSDQPWYQMAYGVDMSRIRRRAFRRFYLTPARILAIIRRTNFAMLLRGLRLLFNFALLRALKPSGRRAPPVALHPAGRSADAAAEALSAS
jgi:radical SAM superfamily enzyme YgiQ (UPF0313 family)